MALEGLDASIGKLKAFAAAIPSTAEIALESGSNLIKIDAKERVAYKTGHLRRSIDYQTVKRTKTEVVVATGTNMDYAKRIEYGFAKKDKLGRKYNQPPRPYLRPAYYTQKAAVEKEVEEVFNMLTKRI